MHAMSSTPSNPAAAVVRPADPCADLTLTRRWIAQASSEDMLSMQRFEPLGSPWYQGEVGSLMTSRLVELRAQVSDEHKVAASKRLGWK
jgi:hypothetical protein